MVRLRIQNYKRAWHFSPGQLAVSQVTHADKEALRFACCAAPAAPLLVTAFLLLFSSPSVLTPFGYSALVPAVSP